MSEASPSSHEQFRVELSALQIGLALGLPALFHIVFVLFCTYREMKKNPWIGNPDILKNAKKEKNTKKDGKDFEFDY